LSPEHSVRLGLGVTRVARACPSIVNGRFLRPPDEEVARYRVERPLVKALRLGIAASSLAERLRSDVAEQRIQNGADGQIVQVTASFGVDALNGTRPVEEAIERADEAMYRAKMVGRDRVEVFGMTKDGP